MQSYIKKEKKRKMRTLFTPWIQISDSTQQFSDERVMSDFFEI